jgi:signal transduction histidine kinase
MLPPTTPAQPADALDAAGLVEALLNVSLTGIILFRPLYEPTGTRIVDLAYEHLNPAAQRMLGLPACPPESFLTLFPAAAHKEDVFAFFCNTFREGQLRRHEFHYPHDGLDGYFYLAAQRQGERLVVSFTDSNTQPRSAIEEALRVSQARAQAARAEAEHQSQQLTAIVAQTPVAIGYFEGPDLLVTAANEMLTTMWGRTPAEVVGRPLLEGVPELQGQGFDDLMRQVRETGTPFVGAEAPARMLRGDQLQTTYYNFVYQPLLDKNGRILGVIDVAVEVTEQVAARQRVQALNEELAIINEELTAANEEYLVANAALTAAQQELHLLNQELEARVQRRTAQLAAQQADLQRLFKQAPVAITVLRGPSFLIEQANEQAEAIWGCKAADVLGRPHFEAIPGSAGQGVEEILTGVLTSGEVVVLHEMPIVLERAHTGRPNLGYYTTTFTPLRDEQQRITGVAVIWVELTDQVVARQQVQRLNEELTATIEELHTSNTSLTHTNADLDTFVYTASHDLKSPIANIEGLLNLLRDRLPSEALQVPTVEPILRMMDGAVARFQETLGHLTDVSRLYQDQPEPALVDLSALIEAIRLDMLPELTAADATFTVDLTDCLEVEFAPKNLRSILYNLLSNAIKYRAMDRPSQVHIHCSKGPGQVMLAVQDNGLGLSEQQQQDLFRLFRRLHTHVSGSGVGLYMAKKMVDNAGGTLTVASQPGVGSTFTVTLPVTST